MKNTIFYVLLAVVFFSCHSIKLKDHRFSKPVNTSDREIKIDKRTTFSIDGSTVLADNNFDGSRLNGFRKESNVFIATISPENEPINYSPYYSFRIWSTEPKSIQLKLEYTLARHRYYPKISQDGEHWEEISSEKITFVDDSTHVILDLDLTKNKLWVSAQEIHNSTDVKEWCSKIDKDARVRFSEIGKSKLDRPMWMLDLHNGEIKGKDIIVLMTRQHPPEVTGYLAFKSFVEELLADTHLSKSFLNKYRLLVFPLMNPDGVDLGHWRHNAGGIDLNRDWAYYNQPETKVVANKIVDIRNASKSEVILGLDFHSTWYDVYYTNDYKPKQIAGFKDFWIEGIQTQLKESAKEAAAQTGGPVSKGWFKRQFQAESITYEIGDETPRDFIATKGQISAREMMKLLVLRRGN